MPSPVVVRFVGPLAEHTPAGRATSHILDALRQRCRLRASITTRRERLGVMGGLASLGRAARASLGILLGPAGPSPRLYLPLDRSLDLYNGVMLALAARLRGYRVFLHHVRGRWLDEPESLIGLIDRIGGAGTVHVLPCEELISRLRWVYRTQKQCVPAPRPAASLNGQIAATSHEPLGDRPFRLGVILDIGPDPAVTDAMNTFVLIRERVGPCQLVAVGEPVRQTHRKHLDDARIRYDDAVEDRGPVDKAGLTRFFHDIDVLLLPARETSDAWPPSAISAMAMGVPIIARAAGSLRSLVGDTTSGGGSVIDTTADFPRKAMRLVQAWRHDPSKYDDARRQAAQRGAHMTELAQQQFDAFLDLIAPQAQT